MNLQRFNASVNNISKLGDNPNVDNSLSAAALKARFDLAPETIKTFINAMLAEIEQEAADKVHTHTVSQITDFSTEVASDISTHNTDASAHSAAISAHNTNASAHSTEFAAKENLGKATIGGTEYTLQIGAEADAAAGYITFVVES